VDLSQLREASWRKPIRRPDKSGPQAPMDKRDLALDQSTHEDIVAVTDGSRHREDLVTSWMRPPAPSNGRTRL
jgi:hypothetical protein